MYFDEENKQRDVITFAHERITLFSSSSNMRISRKKKLGHGYKFYYYIIIYNSGLGQLKEALLD